MALGHYPSVSLKQARTKRDDARRALAGGADPQGARQVRKLANAQTFAVIADEWLHLQRKRFAPATMAKADGRSTNC